MSTTSNDRRRENLKAGTIKLCLDCRIVVRHNISGRCIACDERHRQCKEEIKQLDATYNAALRKHKQVA